MKKEITVIVFCVRASISALLKKHIGKAACFTYVAADFAGTNMRKYETI